MKFNFPNDSLNLQGLDFVPHYGRHNQHQKFHKDHACNSCIGRQVDHGRVSGGEQE